MNTILDLIEYCTENNIIVSIKPINSPRADSGILVCIESGRNDFAVCSSIDISDVNEKTIDKILRQNISKIERAELRYENTIFL